jgi:cobalt-precorrin-5B (C1)-methyltransferase
MSNRGVRLHPTANWRRKDLREGYTTGACAAASAAAATRALLTGEPVEEIVIDLPVRSDVAFPIERCEISDDGVMCGTIKDAGDDPDVTDGAEIRATVAWTDKPGVHIGAGKGVGVATLPGLAVEVGEPAINPAPRRQIESAVVAEMAAYGVPYLLEGHSDGARGLLSVKGMQVTISVPGGEELAEQTMNPRLGIVGGISILGTTGIVKPYSESAYRASIYVELKVAAENGVRRAILTTGRRSETYALAHDPSWTELGAVQVGDHIGYGLRLARRLGFQEVVIAGMIGKLSKLAQGRMQTHVSEGEIDFDFLAGLTDQLGAGPELVERARTASTAHYVQNILREAGVEGLERRVARLAARQAVAYVELAFPVQILLFDIGGDLLAAERSAKVDVRGQ